MTANPEKLSPLSPERWAKIREHARLGAHAVATLADVEALQAEIDELNAECADILDRANNGQYCEQCSITPWESLHGRY